jgi:hypothetical protein
VSAKPVERCTNCPLLAGAAEAAYLSAPGVRVEMPDPVVLLVVGRLRAERGCRGPEYGRCRWAEAGFGFHRALELDPNVPLLMDPAQRARLRKDTGEYL